MRFELPRTILEKGLRDTQCDFWDKIKGFKPGLLPRVKEH